MNRISRLPVRNSTVNLEPGSTSKNLSRNKSRKTRASSTSSRSTLTMETPHMHRSKSSLSLRPTPQSVLRTRSIESKRPKKKESRPIQDKKWQMETLAKVEYYFQNDVEAMMILNKSMKIRPITTHMFVQLMNILLRKIAPSIEELTVHNYVKLIPQLMSMLLYPGALTASTLKTANTPHSWPHVLAVLSWLVDLINLTTSVEQSIKDCVFQLPEDALEDQKLLQAQSKILIKAFGKWNTGQDEGDIEGKFEKEMRRICDISDEQFELKMKLKENLIRRNKEREMSLQLLLEEKKKGDAELEDMDKNYQNLEEYRLEQRKSIEKLKQRIEEINRDNKKLCELDDVYEKGIKELNEKISTQPMSTDERDERLRITDEAKTKCELKQQEIEKLQKMKDDADISRSHFRRNMEETIKKLNENLEKSIGIYPELQQFKLRETRLLHPDFYEDIKDKIKKFNEFHKKLEEKLKISDQDLQKIDEKESKKLKELNEVEKRKNDIKSRLETIEKQFEDEQNEYLVEENKQLQIIEEYKRNIEEIRNSSTNTETKEKEIEELTEHCHNLQRKIKENQEEFIKFLEKENEDNKENEKKYKEMRNKITAMINEFGKKVMEKE